jgi:FkbM family methyltransferase
MGFTFAWAIASEQWRQLQDYVSPGDCAYDIGANRGQSTLFIAKRVGASGQVVAFEPVPCNVEDLRENIDANGLTQVIVAPFAAAAENGTCEFLFDDDVPTQGRLSLEGQSPQLPNVRRFNVSTIRLDDAFQAWRPPQFMKIDVEGGAGAVLAGAHEILHVHRPTVLVELHGDSERQAVLNVFGEHDFIVMTTDGAIATDEQVASLPTLVFRKSS